MSELKRANSAAQDVAEQAEPTANLKKVPLWLIILFGVMFYGGQLYLDHAAGGFNPQVYEPYDSYASVKKAQPDIGGGAALMAKGEKIYGLYCVACHQVNGGGNPSANVPPLVGSEWVTAKAPGRLIRIVSKGFTGPVNVKGQTFSGNNMLALGDQFPGDEAQKAEDIAAVLTFVRDTFGGKAPPVTPAQVKKVREKIKDRTDQWTEAELLGISEDE
jgi:mono/diheme cytochrome c family protein